MEKLPLPSNLDGEESFRPSGILAPHTAPERMSDETIRFHAGGVLAGLWEK